MTPTSVAIAAAALLTIGACGDDGPATIRITEFASGFDGPTQLALARDGRLVVAELNGAEGAGSGRVLAVDLDDPSDREVLVADLLTPTGAAVDGDLLWIMEQRRLTAGPFDDPTGREVVLDRLPYNGRSEGTLTTHPDGGVLYDTSGRRDGTRLAAGSGTLWYLAGPAAEPELYATGLKHAYAHTFDQGGRLWSTEMSDGRLDGVVPPDELIRVERGDDFGYPRCVGNRTHVAELGADSSSCVDTPSSHALFDPGATPTSVAVAPWDPATILVALWNRGEIRAVPTDPGDAPHAGEVVVSGLDGPQHLLAVDDVVYVSEHGSGRILRISAR